MEIGQFVIFNVNNCFKNTVKFSKLYKRLKINKNMNRFNQNRNIFETIFEKVMQTSVITVVGILYTILLSLITALVVWPLWNWLMPLIFGLTKITYVQTVGITILTTLLFRMGVNWNKNK